MPKIRVNCTIFLWLPSGVTDGLVVIVLANESFFSDGTGSIPAIGAIYFLEFLDQFHHFTKQKYFTFKMSVWLIQERLRG